MSFTRKIIQSVPRPSFAARQFTTSTTRWITPGPNGSLTGNSTTDPAAGASVKPSTKGTESPKSHEQNELEQKTSPNPTPVQGSNSHKKTQAELDQETLSRLQGRDNDGGAAGISKKHESEVIGTKRDGS